MVQFFIEENGWTTILVEDVSGQQKIICAGDPQQSQTPSMTQAGVILCMRLVELTPQIDEDPRALIEAQIMAGPAGSMPIMPSSNTTNTVVEMTLYRPDGLTDNVLLYSTERTATIVRTIETLGFRKPEMWRQNRAPKITDRLGIF